MAENDQGFGRDAVAVEQHESVFRGHFRLDRWRLKHRLFAGGWGRPIVRELLERGAAAALLPYDPIRDQVVLIEQFRIGAYAAGDAAPWLLEPVAGMMEPDEKPEEVARRETQEECGGSILALEPIPSYYATAGCSSEFVWMFCGRVDAGGIGGLHGLPEEGEDIRVKVMPFADAMAALEAGRVRTSPGVVALLWLALNRERLRQAWR